MSTETIIIKDLGQEHIDVARDCHLCGEPFVIGMFGTDTICPRCKKLWKEFIGNRSINLNVNINKDIE